MLPGCQCVVFGQWVGPCDWLILPVLETIIIIIHSFYIALFPALEQTNHVDWHVFLNE